MINAQDNKIVQIIAPQAIVDNDDPVGAFGDASPASVDTAGFRTCTIYVLLGAIDIAMTALGVYEGEAAASGADDATYSLVANTAFSGSTGTSRLPQALDDGDVFAIHIDLRAGVKRYLSLDATCGNGAAGTFITAFAVLSDPIEGAQSVTDRGLVAETFNI